MSSTRPLIFPVLAALLLSTGCLASAEDAGDPMTIEPMPAEPADVWTGSNGEWPPYYRAMLSSLPGAFDVPLADPAAPTSINPALLAMGFAETAAGQEVFKYLVRCAVAPSTGPLSHPVTGVSYAGEGILVGTSGWRSQPLPAQYQSRVHECLMAFLNGYNQPAPIAIQSPTEVAPLDDPSNFPITEAAWVSEVSGGIRYYRAFLSEQFKEACPSYFEIVNQRICATPNGNCGITVSDWAGSCQAIQSRAGTVYCTTPAGLKPALVTKLTAGMYGGCAP
jgi:hypothetical protein